MRNAYKLVVNKKINNFILMKKNISQKNYQIWKEEKISFKKIFKKVDMSKIPAAGIKEELKIIKF